MTDAKTAAFPLGRAMGVALVAAFAGLSAFAGLWSLPPLDRDESRFAQATAQMLETGDFITIRFQESERNKKPAGIYWLQAASVSAFSDVEAREIWAYRLPSAVGAVIAVIFTYLAGARLYGPAAGLLGAFLLAAAPVVAGEATIAKTDAVLLATVCAAQAAFIHAFAAVKAGRPAGWIWPVIFWAALGAGILVKGPITPMIVGFTAVAMFFREPTFRWVAALRPVTGIATLILMIAPWAIAIGLATEGRFFAEAVGGDMLSKVGAAQESHSGPPGYHLFFLWLLFWPAAALLIPGLVHGAATRRAWPSWFLLAWIVPSWIVFELTATKLPHYTLPLYPALALLAARGAVLGVSSRRTLVRRAGAGLYLAIGLAAAGLVAALPYVFGAPQTTTTCLTAGATIAAGTILISFLFWYGRAYAGGYAAAGLSVFLAWTVLNGVLPQLDRLKISPHLSAAIDEAGLHALHDGAPPTALAGYYEPSAIFLLGTQTVTTDGEGAARHLIDNPGAAAAVEKDMDGAFRAALSGAHADAHALAVVDGLNYSNGREVRLTIYALERN